MSTNSGSDVYSRVAETGDTSPNASAAQGKQNETRHCDTPVSTNGAPPSITQPNNSIDLAAGSPSKQFSVGYSPNALSPNIDPGNDTAISQATAAGFTTSVRSKDDISSDFLLPISWQDLSYQVGTKTILSDLCGTALPGRSLAIMGSSGAGKTTFLNAISDRLATSADKKLTGRRQIGDVEYERKYRKVIGFVAQDDILAPLSTPFNAFWFSLRTRRGASRAETQHCVDETLKTLQLMHCKDTVVGIPGLKAGLSGGERKRTSIGVDLICDTKVLLLDEPTSGLDSVTSARIVNLLQYLARLNRTVIYTIHQPTAEVVSCFDDLMLLTQGQCAYHGTMAASLSYFESIGFSCPDKFTPTDYYMVLLQDNDISVVLLEKWQEHLRTKARTPHTYAVRLVDHTSESQSARDLNLYLSNFGSTTLLQFYEVAMRRVFEVMHDKLYPVTLATQSLFFAIVVGLIFFHLRNTIEGLADREGALFMITLSRCMNAAFIKVNEFHKRRALFVREQQAEAYSPAVFYFGNYAVEVPCNVVIIMFESIMLYFMLGLYLNAGSFFIYYAAILFASEVGSGLGYAISASFESLVAASAIAPLILVPLATAGGLFASKERLRPYWYWLEKPSFLRYAYILVMRNELRHIHNVTCDYEKYGDYFCLRQPKNGEDTLLLLGFDNDPQSTTPIMWLSLAILWVLVRVWAVGSLSMAARSKA